MTATSVRRNSRSTLEVHTQLVVPAPQVSLQQPQQQERRDEKEGEADDKLKEGQKVKMQEEEEREEGGSYGNHGNLTD